LSRDERVACLRDELRTAIEGSPCPGFGCVGVGFQPVAAAPVRASEGARILLIDEAIVTMAATRYQSRTLAYLSPEADGTYYARDITINLSVHALAILQAADRFEGPLASEEIGVATPFLTKFASTLPNWAGHGMDILPFLADRIPRAQFVVSEHTMDYPLEDVTICAANNNPVAGEQVVQQVESQLLRTAQSLSKVIRQYSINYIHLSWGVSRFGIERSFQSRCGAVPPAEIIARIQRAYLQLLRTLAGLSTKVAGAARPVVLFQAGTGADRELHVDDADYLSDCTDVPGRLRVFAAGYTGTEIPETGSNDTRYLSSFGRSALACLDLIVNVGYVDTLEFRAAPMFFPASSTGLGISTRPGWPAVSSFANPVGLAYFAYLADQHPDETVAQLLARITNQWTKPTVDPLLYQLFPRSFQLR
jgi:hypothetical protein